MGCSGCSRVRKATSQGAGGATQQQNRWSNPTGKTACCTQLLQLAHAPEPTPMSVSSAFLLSPRPRLPITRLSQPQLSAWFAICRPAAADTKQAKLQDWSRLSQLQLHNWLAVCRRAGLPSCLLRRQDGAATRAGTCSTGLHPGMQPKPGASQAPLTRVNRGVGHSHQHVGCHCIGCHTLRHHLQAEREGVGWTTEQAAARWVACWLPLHRLQGAQHPMQESRSNGCSVGAGLNSSDLRARRTSAEQASL